MISRSSFYATFKKDMSLLTNMSLLIGIIACITLSSCNQSPKPYLPDTSHSKNMLKVYLQSEPLSLDPRVGGDRRSQMVLRELFEGLERIDQEGHPQHAIADNVTISEDGCTYHFHLRPAFWSNGDKVTATDFEYAWKSNVTPGFPSHYPYAFFILKNGRQSHLGEVSVDQVGVKALDDENLEVLLEHPAPYFLEFLANPIYSPVCRRVSEADPDWFKNATASYVTNGPFTLEKWGHQAEVVLKKSTTYWDNEKVKLDGISFAIIENPQTALNMYERNDIDWVGEPFGNLPLEAIHVFHQNGTLHEHRVGGLSWFQLNTEHPLLKSVKIRQALASAINRKEITEHLLQGGEMPAFSILPEKLTLHPEPLFQDNDLTTARKLFQEGLQELGLSKESLPSLTISHWAEPREKAMAEEIQNEWQRAFEIPITLTSSDWSTYLAKFRTGDFEAAGANWFSWYFDPIYNLDFIKYRNSGFNGTRWEDARYISLLDQSDVELNPEKRRQLLAQAENLVIECMPVIPIYSQTYKYLKQPYVKGDYLSPVGQLELKDVVLERE